jgi:hypothetical protein
VGSGKAFYIFVIIESLSSERFSWIPCRRMLAEEFGAIQPYPFNDLLR